MNELPTEEKHSCTRWFIRQFENDYDLPVPEGGHRADALVYDKDGKVLNKLLFEDPQIAKGTNFNLLLDAGKEMVWATILALASSGSFLTMAYGASSTAAAHGDTHLAYEHILDGTRIPLQNTSSTQMTYGSVVSLTTYTDVSYTPNITYYTQAAVMGTINGATSFNNKNQPVQEFGLASNINCPTTPSGVSGVLLNHFILGAPIIITVNSTIQIICQLVA